MRDAYLRARKDRHTLRWTRRNLHICWTAYAGHLRRPEHHTRCCERRKTLADYLKDLRSVDGGDRQLTAWLREEGFQTNLRSVSQVQHCSISAPANARSVRQSGMCCQIDCSTAFCGPTVTESVSDLPIEQHLAVSLL
jgi:hypothetical protein